MHRLECNEAVVNIADPPSVVLVHAKELVDTRMNSIDIDGEDTDDSTPTSAAKPYCDSSSAACITFREELWASLDCIFQSKLTWLLLLGPIAIAGDSLGLLGEPACFALSGIALIPCAERLSFITEQVAEHTNGTIGALLNATFGNAPELLISVAALRSGFYRVVQLTMLGSMLTNMIMVFGVSCLIGGLRWQVQELRLTSGNVSVVMLFCSTAGSLIPATLILSGQFPSSHNDPNAAMRKNSIDSDIPTQEEITLSRVNAAVMFILYLCYLLFQLETHKDEFDDSDDRHRKQQAQPNVFCRRFCSRATAALMNAESEESSSARSVKKRTSGKIIKATPEISDDECDEEEALININSLDGVQNQSEASVDGLRLLQSEQRRRRKPAADDSSLIQSASGLLVGRSRSKSKSSDIAAALSIEDDFDFSQTPRAHEKQPLISMRVGIFWLFVVTIAISAMTDILVDTIDGFALRMQLSEVFTSFIIIPFFSNVAEQVSAFLFAYRNEMDLCVGVTIGSAIQIATFVLPGSVLIGMWMDRSMTLYFHTYETVCLFLCTVIVAAILQGGTTNWFVGAMLIGIYIMVAAGIWFHEIENLSVDAEDLVDQSSNNRTA